MQEEVTGTYVLRVIYDGCLILSEPCESPEKAILRSLRAFTTLASGGWLHDGMNN
jgi:hypothetical protein